MTRKVSLKKILFFLWLFLSVSITPSKASNVTIKAKLDSINIIMGRLNTLRLEIVKNKDVPGYLSIFNKEALTKGYVSVCGDSVELKTDFIADTTELGSGRIQIDFAIPVQAFDSGTYILPKFVYYSGTDSAVSKNLTFNVYPVKVNPDEEITPYKNIEEPDGKRFYDWLPDWLLDFWWIWLVIFLGICAFLYGMKNYKKQGIPFISPRPMPKPWEIALGSLQRLKGRKLWEQGLEKEYFTDLTDILREYLFSRFGINAMEMTTRQIMDKIYESDLRDKKDYVRQILNVADFVKFAKVRPLPADSISAMDNAVKFVEETIPSETVVEEDNLKEEEKLSQEMKKGMNSEKGGKG